MKAFHAAWSRPYFVKNSNLERKTENFYMEDYDLLSSVLSALMWRKYNGSIKLCCDRICGEYIKGLGIGEIWDLGIDTSMEDVIDYGIDADMFWSLSKIYGLLCNKAPVAVIDRDIIFWNSLQSIIENNDIVVAHRERVIKNVYPKRKDCPMVYEYYKDKEMPWNVLPCNTSILYIEDDEFKRYYCNEAISLCTDFSRMKNIRKHALMYTVFAEQWLISMCAYKKSKNIYPLISTMKDIDTSRILTHIWIYKEDVKKSYYCRQKFCRILAEKIASEFPEYIELLRRVPQLKSYMMPYTEENLFHHQ